MSGITDLAKLLSSLKPKLIDGEFVFLTLPDGRYGDGKELHPVASFAEPEGLTLIVPKGRAEAAGVDFDGVFRLISLQVHSSLEAVGLTAAVAEALAAKGISANVVAAFYHDHLFVPASRADEALNALSELAAKHQP